MYLTEPLLSFPVQPTLILCNLTVRVLDLTPSLPNLSIGKVRSSPDM